MLASLGILIWGINYLKGKNFFFKRKTVYAIYNQVDGLASSNPIEINGLKVGQVGEVKFLEGDTGRILVSMWIETDLKIPKNSVAKIVSADLMGSKAVRIILGNG